MNQNYCYFKTVTLNFICCQIASTYHLWSMGTLIQKSFRQWNCYCQHRMTSNWYSLRLWVHVRHSIPFELVLMTLFHLAGLNLSLARTLDPRQQHGEYSYSWDFTILIRLLLWCPWAVYFGCIKELALWSLPPRPKTVYSKWAKHLTSCVSYLF